jgi:hypothetical protein
MSLQSAIIIFAFITFIGGISVGIYNGSELTYNSSYITIPADASVLQQSLYKIVDGIMMLCFECANIVAKFCLDNGYDLNWIMKAGITLFYLVITLAIVYFIVKLFVYIYIIYHEIKLTKRENEWLKKGDKK